LKLKIAITGASGFIGSNYLKLTKPDFAEIVPVSRQEILHFDYKEKDVVIHLAAIAHTKGVHPDEYYEVNRDLAIKVAQKAKNDGVKQFVFLSSIKVYGDLLKTKVCSVIDSPDTEDAYGKSKFQAEREILKLADSNFNVSIIRTPLVYGAGVKANMLNLIHLVDKNYIIPLGGINNRRSLIYVGNLVNYINRIIELNAGGTFLVSDGKTISTTQLVKSIADKLNRKVFLITIPAIIILFFKIVTPSFAEKLWGNCEIDSSDSFKKVNFIPTFTFDEGIEQMVGWYKNNS